MEDKGKLHQTNEVIKKLYIQYPNNQLIKNYICSKLHQLKFPKKPSKNQKEHNKQVQNLIYSSAQNFIHSKPPKQTKRNKIENRGIIED